MKVTINFSREAYTEQFVNNANSIKSSVTVELSAEKIASITASQRALLLKYTVPCKDKTLFDEEFIMVRPTGYSSDVLMYWRYTEDVFEIISECEALIDKSKQNAVKEMSEFNASVRMYDDVNAEYAYLYYYPHNTTAFHGFGWYEIRHGKVTVRSNKIDRQTMRDKLKEMNFGDKEVGGRDELVAQLVQLSEKAYDKYDASEEREKERKQREEERAERVSAWIAAHGSDYLKDLKQNDFDYYDVYEEEYASFTYGERAHLGNETYKFGRDYDDVTDKVCSPTPEHLNKFLRFKNAHPLAECTLEYICREEDDYKEDYDTPALKYVDYDECSAVFANVNDPYCYRNIIYVQL